MAWNHPTLHGITTNLAELIRGDIVATHPDDIHPSTIVGTVDTVGQRFVNVVAADGSHYAYTPEQIDRLT
jgi:hypothetical protein